MSTDYQNYDQSTNKNQIKKQRFAIIYENILENPSIPHSVFRLCCYLKSFNPCFPSYSRITKATGLNKSSISRGIKWLVDNNMLEYEKGNHSISSNRYYFIDQAVSKEEVMLVAESDNPSRIVQQRVLQKATTLVAESDSDLVAESDSNRSNFLTVQSNNLRNTEENIQKKISHTPESKPKKAKKPKKQSDDSCESSRVSPQEVMNLWNSVVDKKGTLSRVRVISDKQKRDIAKTSKTLFKTISDWDLYFHSLYHSKFLLGQTKEQWRVSFDWAVAEKNAVKVFNGNYFKQDKNTQFTQEDDDLFKQVLVNLHAPTTEGYQFGHTDYQFTL